VTRVRARVEGTVQGVGFRPYVHGLATELGLSGYVLNDARGVLLEVEGEAVDRFLARLPAEAPPLASVERVDAEPIPATGEPGFAIRSSPRSGVPDAAIVPDAATCDECLRELFDPADRRYRYPFVNCTNCGPRFTIVTGVPYDRPFTTMAGFTMCAACQAEYDDLRDRRFHAQPNACPGCGPRVRLVGRDGATATVAGASSPASDGVAAAARALCDGAIVAVKGVGGFHLACRADDERAVAALRARKHREERAFALMVADVEAARALVALDDTLALTSRARPIVLAPRLPGARVAAAVAPRSRELGVMLPYSPLHHLLLADVGVPLVMTSGNVADEPIAYTDADALPRLAGIADLFLVHDRPIHTRTDDSVVRGGRVIRRSRGYVPASLPLAPAPPLLACGAELKSTFCLARDGRAWVGHHVGDLRNYETLRSFSDGIAHFERLFAVAPELVAHDLHPEYLSTKYALEREGVETVGVQHHHAHLAACLAEHGEPGPVAGAIYDGTGYGLDGTVWGGELLSGDLAGCERAGHLWPVRMPGGEAAIREPWRMACAWLAAAGVDSPLTGVDPAAWERVASLARSGFASPVTTSMGRLFDAVAALCGIRRAVTYEGQAAIELEAAADRREAGVYPLPLGTETADRRTAGKGEGGTDAPGAGSPRADEERAGSPRADAAGAGSPRAGARPAGAAIVLDARETVLAVVRDRGRGVDVPVIAARFHNAVAAATAAALLELGDGTVVLSGGVFQNELLLAGTAARLRDAGVRVLIPERLPLNDGGIAYGQAAVAAARAGPS
jgi:hydrogenase maturation protein HypF